MKLDIRKFQKEDIEEAIAICNRWRCFSSDGAIRYKEWY